LASAGGGGNPALTAGRQNCLVKREIILLLLRCLSTEPELCGEAIEAAARDPAARAHAERLVVEAAALAAAGGTGR
jgi:hypothetical protein